MASRSPYPKPEDPRRALFTNPIGISPWITTATKGEILAPRSATLVWPI